MGETDKKKEGSASVASDATKAGFDLEKGPQYLAKRKEFARPNIDTFDAGLCNFAKKTQINNSFEYYAKPCERCFGCRMMHHEAIVGAAVAESITASVVLLLTLTYAPNGDGTEPDGAKVLDKSDMKNFMKALRKKYRVRKVISGEYGKSAGRAHWHVLLYFQYPDDALAVLKDEIVSDVAFPSAHCAEWEKTAPPLVMSPVRPRSEFLRLLADRETLVVSVKYPGYPRVQQKAQYWRFWPHGTVDAQLLKSPDFGQIGQINQAVRYCLKYLTKDPWKDTEKYRDVPFDALPDWIKEGTKYRRVAGKINADGTQDKPEWKRGNRYADDLLAANLSEFASDDDVPIERRVRKPYQGFHNKPALGSDYFQSLGVRAARRGKEFFRRQYVLQGVYMPASLKSRSKAMRKGIAKPGLSSDKMRKFSMRKTSFREFGEAFEAECVRLDKEPTGRVFDQFTRVKEMEQRARDKASGEYGYVQYNRASVKHQAALREQWGWMALADLKGTVPRRWIERWAYTEKTGGWPRKKRELEAMEYINNETWRNPLKVNDRIRRVGKKWMFERDLKPGELWWKQELLTVGDLRLAQSGKIQQPHAEAARGAHDYDAGDPTLLAGLSAVEMERLLKS